MKKLELVFNVIAIFLDACMLLLAGISAFSLRYQARDLFSSYPILFELNLYDFIRIIVIVIPLIVLIMAAYGLYNLRSTTRYLSVLTKVVAGISTGLGIFVIFYFFDQTIFPSRLIVLVSWALAMIFVSIGRVALILIETWFLKQGIGYHRLVVIADEKEDFGITQELAVNPALGYRIVATINDTRNALDQLRMIKDREGIDEILLANQHSTGRLNEEILNFAHDFGIKLNYVPSIIEAQRTNITLSNIGIIPIVELKNTPLDGWGKIVKRVMDIFLSLSALILLSPLFILVIIGIKLDSAGRILFVQDRYGQGRPFRFYKFRSMFQNLSIGNEYGGEQASRAREILWKQNARQGPFLKIKNDPRVTRFGKFIRLTKLDELPQFINVLKGDMSLVGPRAHVLEEVELYKERYKRQFTIKPGITGLTQITQARVPGLPFEEEIRLDTFYLENWSVKLDLMIMFKTFLVLFKKPRQTDYY